MTIAELLLPEWDAEVATTRRVLERVPDDRAEWKPHEKSFPMAHLAQLVARLPAWVPMTLDKTELDLQPTPGKSAFPGYSIEPIASLLAEFDRNAADARARIAAADDATLMVPWSLKRAGTVIQTASRYMILRMMVINHLVHHRAQLGLYLRMVDAKVPSMYGPTADDK